jgi:large subunit ribosomal protein L7/L12
MSAVFELGDRIARLTIAEAAELRAFLKGTFGIEPAAGVGVVTPEVIDEPIVIGELIYDVVLDGVDPARKIALIKLVREMTGTGLAEAKGLVDTAGRVIRQGLDKAEAEKVKGQLEAAGAKVRLTAA